MVKARVDGGVVRAAKVVRQPSERNCAAFLDDVADTVSSSQVERSRIICCWGVAGDDEKFGMLVVLGVS